MKWRCGYQISTHSWLCLSHLLVGHSNMSCFCLVNACLQRNVKRKKQQNWELTLLSNHCPMHCLNGGCGEYIIKIVRHHYNCPTHCLNGGCREDIIKIVRHRYNCPMHCLNGGCREDIIKIVRHHYNCPTHCLNGGCWEDIIKIVQCIVWMDSVEKTSIKLT